MATISIDPDKFEKVNAKAASIRVERLTDGISDFDLHDLCDSTDAAIAAGGGFGWLSVPPRQKLQRYWRGCLLIDDRKVVISRVDGVIA